MNTCTTQHNMYDVHSEDDMLRHSVRIGFQDILESRWGLVGGSVIIVLLKELTKDKVLKF